MSQRFEHDLKEYAAAVVQDMHKSGYGSISIIEKILNDPGIASGKGAHRVLWWPRNHRLALISKAMHRIGQREQLCIIVLYGNLKNDDGSIMTKHQFCEHMGIKVRRFNDSVKKGKNKLRDILSTYRNSLDKSRKPLL